MHVHRWMSVHFNIGAAVALLSTIAAFVFSLYAYAHSRIAAIDVRQLQTLYERGLLSQHRSTVENFRTVTAMLRAIAPAVHLRECIWILAYYVCLRMSQAVLCRSQALRREMRRLLAYQAARYVIACERLSDLSH